MAFSKDKKDKSLKIPTASEFEEIIAHIPVERVVLDKEGRVDPEKSPDFYDWMVNG